VIGHSDNSRNSPAPASGKKRFFTNHAKSSAAFVSLAIHAVFIVVALSFVAVTVIKKEDRKFNHKNVVRPKMQLRKLQVPVNIKKRPKPKMRKRIVVKPKVNRAMPDIKMPEISGIKGGMGGLAGAGMGGIGGIGFTLPEIELFGIKSKGEKVFLILDSSDTMMYDEMGGIPAYTIIKNELVRIVDGLPPTTIFNVCVYGSGKTVFLFPSMVPASDANAAKLKAWLAPLNAVTSGMGAKDYGTQTLGPDGVALDAPQPVGRFVEADRVPVGWYRGSMQAMAEKADAVFLLAGTWPGMGYFPKEAGSDGRDEWHKTSAGKKWEECFQKGLKKLDEENAERAARGEPPKVLQRQAWAINKEYFPNIEGPPASNWVGFVPEDFTKAFREVRANSKVGAMEATPPKSGISRKKSKKKVEPYAFNVVHFVKKGGDGDKSITSRYRELTGKCGGEYKTIAGMDAIQGYVDSE